MRQSIGKPFKSSAEGLLAEIADVIRRAGMSESRGDSVLAHITPDEAKTLKKLGGAGKKNALTGAYNFSEEGNDGGDDGDSGGDDGDSGGYGGKDEGDRGRDAASSGGAGGFGSGSLGGGGGNNAGVNTGETYGPSAADFGLAADAWGPADGMYGGLTGRDAYGSRPGAGGTPTTGDVYAGYSPPGTYDGSSFGTKALSALGSLVGGPLGGLLGYGIGSMAFGSRSAPEMGSKIGHDSSMDASTSTSGFGSTGTPTIGEQWSGSDRVTSPVVATPTQIVQSMPQTVLPTAPASAPWRTFSAPNVDWARYGEGAQAGFYDRVNPFASYALGGAVPPVKMARGGSLGMAGMVDGPGDGESDSVPMRMPDGSDGRLSGGEYIIPAADVAALGRGNSLAGARFLESLTQDARSAHINHLAQKPPPRR